MSIRKITVIALMVFMLFSNVCKNFDSTGSSTSKQGGLSRRLLFRWWRRNSCWYLLGTTVHHLHRYWFASVLRFLCSIAHNHIHCLRWNRHWRFELLFMQFRIFNFQRDTPYLVSWVSCILHFFHILHFLAWLSLLCAIGIFYLNLLTVSVFDIVEQWPTRRILIACKITEKEVSIARLTVWLVYETLLRICTIYQFYLFNLIVVFSVREVGLDIRQGMVVYCLLPLRLYTDGGLVPRRPLIRFIHFKLN